MSILSDLASFYLAFEGEKGKIGLSSCGKPIFYFKVSYTSKPTIIIQYSIHAREYITTYLALEQIKQYQEFGRFGTVYFIPMLNPDGVKIALTEDDKYKANARGVDLNVIFDAKWGSGKQNTKIKGSENYIGEKPFSECETKALRDFTLDILPDITISYHSKGEEIYYSFFQDKEALKRDKKIAKMLARITGYKIRDLKGSAGGYKDWCIEKLKIPALTIEVGSDKLSHPIKKEHLHKIFKKNKRVIKVITEEVKWN